MNKDEIQLEVKKIINAYNNLFAMVSDFIEKTQATQDEEAKILTPLDKFISTLMDYQRKKWED